MSTPIICPHCGSPIIGRPNKRFCSRACKDGWHNDMKPRKTARRWGRRARPRYVPS